MKVDDELREIGIDMDGATFDDLVADTFHNMYRDWNPEFLLCQWWEAGTFCEVVRRKARPHEHKQDHADEFILRRLLNIRKRPSLEV